MVESQSCVACGKRAPETETSYTLISAQFGWRLTRFKGEGGAITLEWRCPVCWREYKRVRAAASAPPGAPTASVPPSAPRSPRRPPR